MIAQQALSNSHLARMACGTTAGNVVLEAHGWIRFAPTTNLPLLIYGDVQSLGLSGVKQFPSNNDDDKL